MKGGVIIKSRAESDLLDAFLYYEQASPELGTEFIECVDSVILSALKEVVTTMSGRIIEEACVSLPLLGSGFKSDDIQEDASMAKALEMSLESFHKAILSEAKKQDIGLV